MQNNIKDVSFCLRKGMGHSVPRDQMTKMLADDGKTWIRTCVDCKDAAIERRNVARRISRVRGDR